MKLLAAAAAMIVIGLFCMGFAPHSHPHDPVPSLLYVLGVSLTFGGIIFAALIGLAAFFKPPPDYGMKD